METIQIHISSGKPMDRLMIHLDGRVFHVTKECYWSEINASGEIRPNFNGELQTTFGSSENSYFRKMNCVSVFDYRNIKEEEPQKYVQRCRPTRPLSNDASIAILIFKPEIYPKLILRDKDKWMNERPIKQVVPYIEAGHPGPIQLSLVEKVLIVTTSEAPNPLAAMLK